MSVWPALPRLLVSSRCPHNVRFLVEGRLSSSIRRFSTNAPVTTKTPEDSASQFSELLKNALKQADSKVHKQHSAPRLRFTTNALTLRPFKKKKRKKTAKAEKKKAPKAEKKAASQKDRKSKQRESRESILDEESRSLLISKLPLSQDLEATRSTFPSENWVAEPWARTSNLHNLVSLSLS